MMHDYLKKIHFRTKARGGSGRRIQDHDQIKPFTPDKFQEPMRLDICQKYRLESAPMQPVGQSTVLGICMFNFCMMRFPNSSVARGCARCTPDVQLVLRQARVNEG